MRTPIVTAVNEELLQSPIRVTVGYEDAGTGMLRTVNAIKDADHISVQMGIKLRPARRGKGQGSLASCTEDGTGWWSCRAPRH